MSSSKRPGGTDNRTVRHYQLPASLAGKLWVWRYLILRRLCQITVLFAFVGTLQWNWALAGAPLLRGDLSASLLLGVIPLADPLAVLQILLTRHALETQVLIGAAIVVIFYALVGGRGFCAWVCPLNPVTDLAGWCRKHLKESLRLREGARLPRRVRYWVLGLSLVLSAITGVAAFEWISPIGVLQRGLIFGMGAGWLVVAGVFLFDLAVTRDGWCGHLCPLGAFYALLGPVAQVRVAFDAEACTRCGDCATVCPEPQVLDLERATAAGLIKSGECNNCGRCVPVCPEGSLSFGLRKSGKH